MFTLERREGESLVIQHNGEELHIKLMKTQQGQIMLNLSGPRSFDVGRKEIIDAVKDIERLLRQ